MLTMMQKRADFAGWLEDLLQVHDSRFFVDTLEHKEIEVGTSRKTTVSVIPRPVRYAAVHDRGAAAILGDGLNGAGNLCDFEAHRFDVRIFWGKEYTNSYSTHSQSLFEAMVYNASDAAKPGILATIREGRNRLIVSGGPYSVGNPGGDAFENLQRGSWDFGDIGAPEMAHYLSFTVTLY